MRIPILRELENEILEKVTEKVVAPLVGRVATELIIRKTGKGNNKDKKTR